MLLPTEDLDASNGGDIETLISSRPDSLMVSWEDVQFYSEMTYGNTGSSGNVNVQAELFANGAVNICYGEGGIGVNTFAAGIEGGGVNDPYWDRDAVAYPVLGLPFNSVGITSQWPTNTCYCFTPGEAFIQADLN